MFGWCGYAPSFSSSSYIHSRSLSESDRVASEDADDDGLDGSTNGLGLADDDGGFGAGSCTSFFDPWSSPGGAELDDACASDNARSGTSACTTFVDPWSAPGGAELDDSTGFLNILKCSSTSRENSLKSSSIRFPNTVTTSLGMCTTSTLA